MVKEFGGRSSANAVNQYTLSEGFNIATASFDGGAFTIDDNFQ